MLSQLSGNHHFLSLSDAQKNNLYKDVYASRLSKSSYVDVSFEQFEKCYSPSGSFGRKVIAIPYALTLVTVVIIQTIFQVAILPLELICKENKEMRLQHMRACVFYFVTGCKESYSHLIMLFNDRKGSYFAQMHKLNRICIETSWQSKFFGPAEAPIAIAISILTSNSISSFSKKELTSVFAGRANLQPILSGFTEKKAKEILNQLSMNDAQLALLTSAQIALLDFSKLSDASLVKLFPCSKEDVYEWCKWMDVADEKGTGWPHIAKKEFAPFISRKFWDKRAEEAFNLLFPEQLSSLLDRLTPVSSFNYLFFEYDRKFTEESYYTKFRDKKPEVIHTLKVRKIDGLYFKKLQVIPNISNVLLKMANSLESNFKAYMLDGTFFLNLMDYSSLSAPQIQELLKILLPSSTSNRHLYKLPGTAIRLIQSKLTFEQIQELSNTQLTFLDYSKLTSSQIQELFNHYGSSAARMQKLTAENLNQVFDKLSDSQLKGLSITQLSNLDYAKFTSLQVQSLFNKYGWPDRERIQTLTSKTLYQVLDKMSDKQLKELTPAQLSNLDYSHVSDASFQKLFPKLITFENPVYVIENRLNGLSQRAFQSLIGSLSEEHFLFDVVRARLPYLDYSLLRKEQLGIIFSISPLCRANSQRNFALLSGYSVVRILGDLTREQRELLITRAQWNDPLLREFDPSRVGFRNVDGNYVEETLTSSADEQKAAYTVLGLRPGASMEKIKAARKKGALLHHPDKVQKQEGESDASFQARKLSSEEEVKKISNAFALLKAAADAATATVGCGAGAR